MLAVALAALALLPSRALLVPHESLAGVHLGDTPAAVRAAVGARYTVCPGCSERTWFYFGATRETGLAVAFRHNRVAAVFTLGSPRGWRSADGLRIGRLTTQLPARYRRVAACHGYVVRSDRAPHSVTSVFMLDEYVSGFALTTPAEPVCR